MEKKNYQIVIELKNSKPRIWRRILINYDMLLPNFHEVIQIVMGWYNSHLHQFIKNNTFYMEKHPEDGFWEEMDNVDYSNIKINNLLKKENDKIIYEYDFGDSQEHYIKVEKMLPFDEDKQLPICLTGRMACPPEDCGGVWGYERILEAISDSNHPEHQEILDWVGSEFDPKEFDKDIINEKLSRFSFKPKIIKRRK